MHREICSGAAHPEPFSRLESGKRVPHQNVAAFIETQGLEIDLPQRLDRATSATNSSIVPKCSIERSRRE